MVISKRHSPHVTAEMAPKIKHLCLVDGQMQHDVAARFGINQGRVSEIVTGKKFPKASPDSHPPENPQPELPF